MCFPVQMCTVIQKHCGLHLLDLASEYPMRVECSNNMYSGMISEALLESCDVISANTSSITVDLCSITDLSLFVENGR